MDGRTGRLAVPGVEGGRRPGVSWSVGQWVSASPLAVALYSHSQHARTHATRPLARHPCESCRGPPTIWVSRASGRSAVSMDGWMRGWMDGRWKEETRDTDGRTERQLIMRTAADRRGGSLGDRTRVWHKRNISGLSLCESPHRRRRRRRHRRAAYCFGLCQRRGN
jgi:hypothetical protein